MSGIGPARAGDIGELRNIEVEAGRVFATAGMDEIARDEPLPEAELLEYQGDGRAWVAVDEADRPVAYLIAKWVDGAVHVEQVSTHPAHAGQGLGAGLIEHVAGWARERGSPALTLTTFVDVPWNGPYYERLGFRGLPAETLGAGLAAVRAEEAAHGLDRWPRQAMRRDL
jgi:GNAT superfamily N-acetyltransferase